MDNNYYLRTKYQRDIDKEKCLYDSASKIYHDWTTGLQNF